MANAESERERAERQRKAAIDGLKLWESGRAKFRVNGTDVTSDTINGLKRVIAECNAIIARERAGGGGGTNDA